jgi:transposase-like protein
MRGHPPFHVVTLAQEYREGNTWRTGASEVVDEAAIMATERLKALKKENAKLRVENDLLKKAIRFSSEKRQKSSNS